MEVCINSSFVAKKCSFQTFITICNCVIDQLIICHVIVILPQGQLSITDVCLRLSRPFTQESTLNTISFTAPHIMPSYFSEVAGHQVSAWCCAELATTLSGTSSYVHLFPPNLGGSARILDGVQPISSVRHVAQLN